MDKKKITFSRHPMTDSSGTGAIIVIHRIYFKKTFFRLKTGKTTPDPEEHNGE